MKRFFRCLIWFSVGFFLAVGAGFAFGSVPSVNGFYAYSTGGLTESSCFPTAQQACDAAAAAYKDTGVLSGSAPQYTCKIPKSGGSSLVGPCGPICPVNSTYSSGSCICNSGYDEKNGTCVPHVEDCSKYKGQTYTGFSSNLSDFPNIGCKNTCELVSTSVTPGFGGADGGSGGVGLWYQGYVGNYTYSGKAGACQGTTPNSPVPDALGKQGNCPAGQVYQGTINGKPYCGPPTSDKPYQDRTGTTTTTTNSDGSSTTKTDTQTTKCDGTNCTTSDSSSTSNTGTDGGTTVFNSPTNTTTTSQNSYCSQHPTASACGGGGDTPDICKDNPNILACQQAANGASVDDIYQKKGKTFSDVLGNFKNSVLSSQLGAAFTGYLNVSAMSGSCPDMTLNMPGFGVSSTLLNDIFCGSMFYNILQGCGGVILALASFVAFKWAFL